MKTRQQLLELARDCQRAHDEWMLIASGAQFIDEPQCMEAYHRRKTATEAFEKAITEALTSNR